MEVNGLWDHFDTVVMTDPDLGNGVHRREVLAEFQEMIRAAPLQPGFEQAVEDKCNTDFAGQQLTFRASTNGDDLGGLHGAHLYGSAVGDPGDPDLSLCDAIREVYASAWSCRTADERGYAGIDHHDLGVALLVQPHLSEPTANGAAITGNIFDQTGMEPAFFVEVQLGSESVTQPDAGVFNEQYLHYYHHDGSPIVMLRYSNLVPPATQVLTAEQSGQLGSALDEVHQFFGPVYAQADPLFYAMETEFELDGNGDLFLSSVRVSPSWERQ